MERYIKKFRDTRIGDIPEVGGKNASLGEMLNSVALKGAPIPDGFAVTASAFRYFVTANQMAVPLKQLMNELDRNDFSNLTTIGAAARKLFMDAVFPLDLQMAITDAYDYLFDNSDQAVAVRSSATAEDLPDASFAGQHESFLNVKGHVALIYAVRCCFASLYTDRAIKYREDKGFDHDKVFLSVGIQYMVRADKACSGVGFTLEPESGFRNVVHIAGVWGLGENIVQGTVNPDEYLVFKPSLRKKMRAIIQKNLGSKAKMLVYAEAEDEVNDTINLDTPWEMRDRFVLEDTEVETLAQWALLIEKHYGNPMDFEWAKDGINHQLYLIQARPETVHSREKELQVKSYTIPEKGELLVSGGAVGSLMAFGRARILNSVAEAANLQDGDILVTETISPDWDPVLKKVAGIITNTGGRTSHAAIIARELGVAAIVGTGSATLDIKDGEMITISCAEGTTGNVYRGKLKWNETTKKIKDIRLPKNVMAQLIVGDPQNAFQLSFYPNAGVGLMRLEFIIANFVKIHPMALARFDQVTNEADRAEIENLTRLFENKVDYFKEKLAQGVATIAAAFYPKEVIVRMSDFKTNEYAGLLGGKYFEPKEENPMLGFRGASRYYHDSYKEGFRLECEAMKIVRDEMGLTNVKLMIPFCRTPEEGRKVVNIMETFGLKQGKNGLEIFVMAEIPSNVLLAEEFANVFDGFSIGSNDLTQLTLGVDRDAAMVAGLFDEKNAASLKLIRTMVSEAKKLHKKIGLCGQAPSDSVAVTRMLVETGIDSIAFNPDALLKGIATICEAEKELKSYKLDNNLKFSLAEAI